MCSFLPTTQILTVALTNFGSLAQGTYVTNQHQDTDSGLLAGVDFAAFWETLKLRWWVIPVVIGLAVGFLWVQESDLRTEPSSYYMSRTYEARDSTAVLASVGIDPVSVRAFPDANNQLLLLQSAAVREEISAELGREVAVTVSRTRPTFTLVDTLESDGQSSFVFTSAGVPTYSFACTEPVRADCERAIAAYVAKTVEIRRDALTAGLNDLRAVLAQVQRTAPDDGIATKLAAIDVLIERADTPLLEISRIEEAIGATVTSVRRPTYTFGVAGGLLVALLILLQLTYSDSRIRTARQLTHIAGLAQLLGHVRATPETIRDRRASVAVHQALQQSSASHIRYIPVRSALADTTAVQRVAEMSQAPFSVTAPFSELSVSELTAGNPSELDVVVVQRNRDLRTDVVEVLVALGRTGRSVAGVLLVD